MRLLVVLAVLVTGCQTPPMRLTGGPLPGGWGDERARLSAGVMPGGAAGGVGVRLADGLEADLSVDYKVGAVGPETRLGSLGLRVLVLDEGGWVLDVEAGGGGGLSADGVLLAGGFGGLGAAFRPIPEWTTYGRVRGQWVSRLGESLVPWVTMHAGMSLRLIVVDVRAGLVVFADPRSLGVIGALPEAGVEARF